MGGRGSKAKGREYQKEIAEQIAARWGFTIEAMSPKSIGKVVNGVTYVSEKDNPDLRVRQMGQAGADIVCLTKHARVQFPYSVECKIRKALPSLLTMMEWEELNKWLCQATTADIKSIVVFRANRTESWVAFRERAVLGLDQLEPPYAFGGAWVLTTLGNFLEHIEKWNWNADRNK